MVIGESRTELLNWLNELLDLNYTKVEQCGTGAAYCQIMDSIYQDVPISKVKFDMNAAEYQYLSNFKILQSTMMKHKISKQIPVERLIKCKFQDNLEFLQWIKKYWMENKDESVYDPVARRSGVKGVPRQGGAIGGSTPSINGTSKRSTSLSSARSGIVPSKAPIRTRTPSNGTAGNTSTFGNNRNSVINNNGSSATRRVSSITSTNTLQQQVKSLSDELQTTRQSLSDASADLEEYKIAGEGLETERNFYFNKLREIEILTQSVQELVKSGNTDITLNGLLTQVEEILYSTEEGFQVPDEENDDGMVVAAAAEHEPLQESKQDQSLVQPHDDMILDEETF